MSFLTAASDRSSSGSGVSGVSGASFSGVSGFTSSFSFTTVLVLVAIKISYRPLSGETPTSASGSPYPMGRVHVPARDSPLHPTWNPTKLPPVPAPPRPCAFHMSRRAVPEFPAPPPTHSQQKCIPNLTEPRLKPRLTISTAGSTRYPASTRIKPTRHHPGRRGQKPAAPRPDEAPKPSIRASVPSITDRRALTSCNQV